MSAVAPVAVACCRRQADGDVTDLYPDPDSQLLRAALADLGLGADLLSWDDPGAEWSRRAAVVIRSTWDSVDRPHEYLRWVHRVGEATVLINPPEVVKWNLNKTYLMDLEEQGIPVVPTQWVQTGDEWQPAMDQYVIKPAVSAGGRETARYGPAHIADAREHVARLLDAGQTVMVQPYVDSVADPGEISLIFVDDCFTHAVRKGPVLKAGEGVHHRPWERMTFLGLAEPGLPEMDVAQLALDAIHARFAEPVGYARVDLVDDAGGNPLVLEVELVDPNLSLTLFPSAATELAKAISHAIGLEQTP